MNLPSLTYEKATKVGGFHRGSFLTVVFDGLKLGESGQLELPEFRLIFARDLSHRRVSGARKKRKAMKKASGLLKCIKAVRCV